MLLKHTTAINAYFENGFNEKEALLTAGYSETTATGRPQSVFGRPDVKAEIAKRQQAAQKKHEVTVDWLIERFKRLAMSGETLARFKKIQDDGTLMWDFTDATPEDIALVRDLGVEFMKVGRGKNSVNVTKFTIKVPDEQAALMALGRHLGAFTDKVEVTTGEDSIAARIQAGRKRAYGNVAPADTDEKITPTETQH